MELKYPNIEVELSGTDGNSFAVLGKVKKALMRNGVPPGEIERFLEDATSGDSDHLLQTCMKWVDVS